jgi:hypothetical protein
MKTGEIVKQRMVAFQARAVREMQRAIGGVLLNLARELAEEFGIEEEFALRAMLQHAPDASWAEAVRMARTEQGGN